MYLKYQQPRVQKANIKQNSDLKKKYPKRPK